MRLVYLVESKGRLLSISSPSIEPVFTYTIGNWQEMSPLTLNKGPLRSADPAKVHEQKVIISMMQFIV